MKTLQATDVSTIKIDEMYIDVDRHGENDYRFKRNQYELDADSITLYFDLTVYADSDNITSVYIEKMTAHDDFGPVIITADEHEILHDKIEDAITVNTWN